MRYHGTESKKSGDFLNLKLAITGSILAATALTSCSSGEPSSHSRETPASVTPDSLTPSTEVEKDFEQKFNITADEHKALDAYAQHAFIQDTDSFLDHYRTRPESKREHAARGGGAEYYFDVTDERHTKKGTVEDVISFKVGPTIVDGKQGIWVRLESFVRPKDVRLATGEKEDPSLDTPPLEKYYEFEADTPHHALISDPFQIKDLAINGKLHIHDVGTYFDDINILADLNDKKGTLTLTQSGIFGKEGPTHYDEDNAKTTAAAVAATTIFKR